MSSVLKRFFCFVIASTVFLTVLSSCSGDNTLSDEALSSVIVSNGQTTSDITDEVSSNDSSSLEQPNLPKPDFSFKPDTVTMSKDELDKYSYLPKITENMPVLYINTADGSNLFATKFSRSDKLLDLIDYVDATVSVKNSDDEFEINDAVAEVKVRGNYTLNYDKKPIRIKFDKKQSVLDLHDGQKYKNWVLLADWKDLSMLNNVMSFYLGRTILGSDGYYCTDFRNVELYLNGEYWGVYLLAEQQETKDGRSTAPEVEDDYTGTDIGYLFEYDGYYEDERAMPEGSGDPTFTINHYDMPYDQPGYTVKSDIYDDSQLAFLQTFVQNAYEIVFAATQNGRYMGFSNDYTEVVESKLSTSKEVISQVIDVQSLVDTYILNEIACDPDIDWSSFYISLDMTENGSKKLVFEAPWDFDSAYGIKKNYTDYEKLFAFESLNPWFNLLKNEQWFYELVKEKWSKLKQAGVLDNALSLILAHKQVYAGYYEKNYERWSKRITAGNGEVINEINTYTTQAQAADYMYNWLKNRFLYLDSIYS